VENYRHLSSGAVTRLLEAEKDLEAFPGMQHHREVVVARVMTLIGEARKEGGGGGGGKMEEEEEEYYTTLVSTPPMSWVVAYLAANFGRRYDLAEALLYDIFVKTTLEGTTTTTTTTTIDIPPRGGGLRLYDSLFNSLIKRLMVKLDTKDRLLSHVFLIAPRVTMKEVELLAECCEDPKNPR